MTMTMTCRRLAPRRLLEQVRRQRLIGQPEPVAELLHDRSSQPRVQIGAPTDVCRDRSARKTLGPFDLGERRPGDSAQQREPTIVRDAGDQDVEGVAMCFHDDDSVRDPAYGG